MTYCSEVWEWFVTLLSRWCMQGKRRVIGYAVWMQSVMLVLQKSRSVEPLVTEHVLITEQFPTFSYTLHQIESFLCHCHWRATTDCLVCEVEEQLRNLGRGWVIVSFNFFENVTLDPSLVSAPYVPHVLVCFGWFKTWWMHWVELHKTSLYSKGKDAMIIDFKLKILIWFNSPILKHLTCLTPNVPDSIPSPNWAMFPTLEGLGPGL